MESKHVGDSLTEQSHLLMYPDINGSGRLFGGQLLRWIDEVAGITARRHCGRNVTTVAIDNLYFKAGAHLNDTVVLIARVTYVGRTSMEVRVDTYTESFDGLRRPINRAYFVMVAMDENDRPTECPGLIIENESEKAEWEAGERRRELRKIRKREGY